MRKSSSEYGRDAPPPRYISFRLSSILSRDDSRAFFGGGSLYRVKVFVNPVETVVLFEKFCRALRTYSGNADYVVGFVTNNALNKMQLYEIFAIS